MYFLVRSATTGYAGGWPDGAAEGRQGLFVERGGRERAGGRGGMGVGFMGEGQVEPEAMCVF